MQVEHRIGLAQALLGRLTDISSDTETLERTVASLYDEAIKKMTVEDAAVISAAYKNLCDLRQIGEVSAKVTLVRLAIFMFLTS